MARQRSQNDREDYELAKGIFAFGFLVVLYLAYRYKLNSSQMLQVAFAELVVFVLICYLMVFLVKKRQKDLLKRIETLGLKDEVLNFIRRFGKEKSKYSWSWRGYTFDYKRTQDFVKVLREKRVRISYKEIKKVIQKYIDDEEYSLTAESILTKPRDFNALNGTEFESLLKRLFEAIGYRVQLIGGVGDQGGDLIANKNGSRFLIQAKRYSGSVGNAAVQQAVSAKIHYDCTSAIVASTGEFTREAMDLAKTTQVQLIGKKELQLKLMEYLKENWR